MEHTFVRLAAAVEPFHHLDFAQWFAFSSGLPAIAAGALIIIGLVAALAGAQHYVFRVLSPLLGLLFGLAIAPDVHALVNPLTPVSLRLISYAVPIVLGVLGGFFPLSLVFAVMGTVGAVIGAALVSDKEVLLGLVPGLLVGGALGLVLGRYVTTVLTAMSGGLLITGGVVALVGTSSIGKVITSSALGPVVLAIVVAVAGAALQFATYQSDEDRDAKKAESREKKKLDKEQREREKRFAAYRR